MMYWEVNFVPLAIVTVPFKGSILMDVTTVFSITDALSLEFIYATRPFGIDDKCPSEREFVPSIDPTIPIEVFVRLNNGALI